MGLNVENKSIVVPGDVLAEGMDYLPGEGAFRDGDHVISQRLGLVTVDGRALKIIPLAGPYVPKAGDRVICRVIDVTYSAWRVNTNTAYNAMLSLAEGSNSYIQRGADLSKIYAIGDYILAKITNVTGQNLIDITMKGPGLHKLRPGRIIEVDPVKVPRIIGKQGSMVTLVKNATDCYITVGQNGLIWLKGNDPEKEMIAVETIRKIEKEAHKQGLTDTIQNFLKEKVGEGAVTAPTPKVVENSQPADSTSEGLGGEDNE
jgi:exosome complex component RRP4